MNTQTKAKPLILAINEAEKELINLVNKFLQVEHIPCYFLEPIFDKVCGQLKAGAQAELKQVKTGYYAPETDVKRTAQSATEAGGEDDGQRA